MVETPANDSADDRLEKLRQRWEEDRSSRVFLQLAEELRQSERYEEAIAVLGVGLQHHPGWGAAQVALARCQLSVGQAEPAAVTLEGVVRKDPTQMVAYRLLVDAYLELGEAAEAKDRLDLYAELNPEADDLEALEERVHALSEEAGPGPDPPPPVEATPAVEAISDAVALESAPVPVEAEASSTSPTMAPELGDSFDLPQAIDLDADVSPETPRTEPDAVPDGLQHLSGVGPGAIVDAEPAGPQGGGLVEPEPPAPEADDAGPDSVADLVTEEPSSAPPALFGVEPQERPEPSLGRLGSARPLRPLRSSGESSQLAAEAAPTAEQEEPAAFPAFTGPEAEDAAAHEPSEGEILIEEAEEEATPTVTLGHIYLRQGHVEEARGIFAAVLEAEPSNLEASAALRALESPEALDGPGEVPKVPIEDRLPEATPEREESSLSLDPVAPPAEDAADVTGPGGSSAVPPATPVDALLPEGARSGGAPEPAPADSIVDDPSASPVVQADPFPANAGAPRPAAGSALTDSRTSSELDARTLLRDTPIPSGLTDRRVAVLEGYLERIQSARSKDVP